MAAPAAQPRGWGLGAGCRVQRCAVWAGHAQAPPVGGRRGGTSCRADALAPLPLPCRCGSAARLTGWCACRSEVSPVSPLHFGRAWGRLAPAAPHSGSRRWARPGAPGAEASVEGLRVRDGPRAAGPLSGGCGVTHWLSSCRSRRPGPCPGRVVPACPRPRGRAAGGGERGRDVHAPQGLVSEQAKAD